MQRETEKAKAEAKQAKSEAEKARAYAEAERAKAEEEKVRAKAELTKTQTIISQQAEQEADSGFWATIKGIAMTVISILNPFNWF